MYGLAKYFACASHILVIKFLHGDPSGWRQAMLEIGYCCCCGKPNQTTMRTNFILFSRAAAGLPWGHSVGIASTSTSAKRASAAVVAAATAAGVALAKGIELAAAGSAAAARGGAGKTHLASRCRRFLADQAQGTRP